MGIKYRTGQGTSASDFTDLVVKVGDTLPIGTEVDYDGQTAPAGWQEVDDPNVYSTSEIRIGTWINGKPIYRKVINFGTLPNSTTKSIAHNISNLDVLVNCYGTAKRSDGSILVLPNVDKDGLQYSVRFSADSSNLHITTGTDRGAFSGYAILEYTKTTD